ncbi:MAG: ABC transporter ATP-binding protein, partial [Candidatus Izemoplasmatales bacterium]|nr:ABC transporter ATP-binding protein [Candidatus Izemoplasmatales bacterium]
MANKEIDRSQETPVLSLKNLKMYFTSGHGKNKLIVKAVDDVSFDIYKGEVFGLVGESGCGKTTTGRTIIKLYQPTDGEIWFLGELIGAGNLGNKENIKRIKETAKLKISDLRSDLKEELEKTEDTNMASALRKKFNDQIKVVNEEKNKLIYEQKM